MTDTKTRKHPLWLVYRASSTRPRYVEAKDADAAMKKVKGATAARLCGDGINRRQFPELFETERDRQDAKKVKRRHA